MKRLGRELVWGMTAWLMASAAGGGQAPPPPKNLRVLTPEEVLPAMRGFTFALGGQCNDCHVMEPTRDMSLDDKQTKKTARATTQMVNDVNEMIVTGTGKAAAGAAPLVAVRSQK